MVVGVFGPSSNLRLHASAELQELPLSDPTDLFVVRRGSSTGMGLRVNTGIAWFK